MRFVLRTDVDEVARMFPERVSYKKERMADTRPRNKTDTGISPNMQETPVTQVVVGVTLYYVLPSSLPDHECGETNGPKRKGGGKVTYSSFITSACECCDVGLTDLACFVLAYSLAAPDGFAIFPTRKDNCFPLHSKNTLFKAPCFILSTLSGRLFRNSLFFRRRRRCCCCCCYRL